MSRQEAHSDAMEIHRDTKPRILLMGLRRSGKSSIASVVFHKLPPTETIFLESTTRIRKDVLTSFMSFQIWDFPGQLDYFDAHFDTRELFEDLGALIWVVDAQDEYDLSLERLVKTIVNIKKLGFSTNVEVFVHKTDSLNDDLRAEIYQDVVLRVSDDLADAGVTDLASISFYLTSIYDSSVFEALSRVIQKLIPELLPLQNLLDILVTNSGMAKAYLFDVLSKIYIGSDTRPIEPDTYELCAAYVDLVVDYTDLFNYDRSKARKRILGAQMAEVESSMSTEDGTMVYLKEMNRHLALVTVIRNEQAKDKKGMIDYNVHMFQEALKAVFERGWEKKEDTDDLEEGIGAVTINVEDADTMNAT